MDKKKIVAIVLFIFMGFFMFAFANPSDGIYREEINNPEENVPQVEVVEEETPVVPVQPVAPVQPVGPVVPVVPVVVPEVIDVKPEEIILDQNNENIIEVYSEIPKFKARAIDTLGNDVEVNITHNINNAKLDKYLVTFTAGDLTETMDFYVVDTTKPVITLKDKDVLVLRKGNSYKEPGVTVTDNYDTDLEDEVIITGKVDTTKSNIVDLAYNVDDKSGNSADEVTRKVHVVDVDRLVKAIDEGNQLLNKIPEQGLREDLENLVQELNNKINNGKDVLDDLNSLQTLVDLKTDEINKVIEEIYKLTFKVTFVDYDDSEIDVKEVRIFDKVKYPTNPTREGYEFIGWDQKVEEVFNDLTIKATYKRGLSKVTVNIYKENLNGAYNLDKNEELSKPTDMEFTYVPNNETGFTLNEQESNLTVMVLGDGSSTVDVYYDRNTYKANFYINNELYKTVEYKYGASIDAPEYTAPEGYNFSGWSNLGTMPASDKDFNADLEVMKFTVTFKVDGKNYKTQEVEYGKDVDMSKIPDPVKASSNTTIYTFERWDGNITNITEDREVIAVFSEQQRYFTVTFMVDNQEYKTQKVESGKDVDMSKIPNPVKASSNTTIYTFDKWVGNITNIVQDETVTATFKESVRYYTVTVKYYVGNSLKTKEYKVEYEGTITLPNTEQRITLDNGRTYQDFTGWSNNFSNSTKVTKNITVVAEYNKVESDTSNLYVLKPGYQRPQNGEPDEAYKYEKVKIQVKILDRSGKLAQVMEAARKSGNNEAVLALNNDVYDYLAPESAELIRNYKHTIITKYLWHTHEEQYFVNWYVLKYNTGDGWHLDGELIK